MLWAEVVLQAQKIIAGPLRGSVCVRGQFSDQRKSVLQADRVGKPESATLDGTRKCKTRVPISQAHALLNIDAGNWIRSPKAPLVIAVGRFQTSYARAGVRVAGA